MTRLILALLALVWACPALTAVSAGTLIDLGTVHSRDADPRRVAVWLLSRLKRSITCPMHIWTGCGETLHSVHARYLQRVDAIVARRGYRPGVNWISRSFPGHAHNEVSWAERVEIPLRILLAPVQMRRVLENRW